MYTVDHSEFGLVIIRKSLVWSLFVLVYNPSKPVYEIKDEWQRPLRAFAARILKAGI